MLTEKLLEAMRSIRTKSDFHLERSRKLTGSGMPVGGAHFDEFLRGESFAVLLREVGKGQPIADALVTAKAEATEMVQKWNARRGKDYQTHRWTESGLDALEHAARTLKEAA